jgi:crossover junction endodeoxyribonuclease RuvC
MILGIDPGLTGAITLVDDSCHIVSIYDMPVMEKPYGKGKMVNSIELSDMIDEMISMAGNSLTFHLEQVSSMPGQGVASTFAFGRAFGVVEGVIGCKKQPLVYVSPRTWKKSFGLIGKDKDVARTIAMSLYPASADFFKRKKDIGRVDSLLIAIYKEYVK